MKPNIYFVYALFAIAIISTGCPHHQEIAILYVTPDGSGDGSSWNNAFGSIQAAINASTNSRETEIWVAAGTYTGKGGEITIAGYNDVDVDIMYVVALKKKMSLYGGFGGFEKIREERDWNLYPTIIDGDSLWTCIYNADDTIVDGFILKNGSSQLGAGMVNYKVSSAISNCTFDHNNAIDAGGGMYNYASLPTIENCIFVNNTAHNGGGIANFDAETIANNCSFTENSAKENISDDGNIAYRNSYSGGGIYNNNSSSSVKNCTFTQNIAESGGGVSNYDSKPAISNCTFGNNSAKMIPVNTENTYYGITCGGGISNYESSPNIANCSFLNNTAGTGGGMSNYKSTPSIINCKFELNYAENPITNGNDSSSSYYSSTNGGGMLNTLSSPTVINCLFIQNKANAGGGMSNTGSSPIVTNCTFTQNTSTTSETEISNTTTYSPSPYCLLLVGGAGMANESSSPIITNCIFWEDYSGDDSSSEIHADESSAVTITFSCIQGGYEGNGNISLNPMFVDATIGDFRLQTGSPCIDMGTPDDAPETDIMAIVRSQGNGYDIGAYEYAN